MFEMHDLQDVDYENYREKKAREIEERERERRREERDDFGSRRDREYDPEDDDYEFDGPRTRRGWHDRDKRQVKLQKKLETRCCNHSWIL